MPASPPPDDSSHASAAPLKVLAVQATATAGGAQRSFASLMRLLPASGVQPFAVVLDEGPLLGWLERDGVPFAVERQPRLRRAGAVAELVRNLGRRAKAENAAAIFCNMTKAHVFGGVAAALTRTPEVWWQRGVPSRKPIELLAARIPSSAVLASSGYALDAQRALNPRQRLRQVQPGVDVESIMARSGSGEAIRRELGWLDAPVLGIVGRLERWKGQDVFLRAAKRVSEHHPEARFLIVGGVTHGFEGSYPDDVRRLAVELELGDRVFFAGHQDDVFPWFDAMDIVVHGSHSEAFGRVVVEAMSLGKPVIATRLGGPSDIIEHQRSGMLIEPRDPLDMAAAMTRLLDSPDLRAAYSAAARARAGQFTAERSAESLARVLREVAAGRPN